MLARVCVFVSACSRTKLRLVLLFEGNESTEEGVLEQRLNAPGTGALTILNTKPPRWNAELDAWTMDFKGRVKLASKKNFQLIDERDREFGRHFHVLLCSCSVPGHPLAYTPPTTPSLPLVFYFRPWFFNSGEGADAVRQGDQEPLHARLSPAYDSHQGARRGAFHLCGQTCGDVKQFRRCCQIPQIRFTLCMPEGAGSSARSYRWDAWRRWKTV